MFDALGNIALLGFAAGCYCAMFDALGNIALLGFAAGCYVLAF